MTDDTKVSNLLKDLIKVHVDLKQLVAVSLFERPHINISLYCLYKPILKGQQVRHGIEAKASALAQISQAMEGPRSKCIT